MASSSSFTVQKTDTPDPVNIGNVLTYIITFTFQSNFQNDFNLLPSDVIVIDTLPSTVSFLNAASSVGAVIHSGEPTGGTVTWMGGFTAIQSIAYTLTITVEPNEAGSIINTAVLGPAPTFINSLFGIDPSNNSAQTSTLVQSIIVSAFSTFISAVVCLSSCKCHSNCSKHAKVCNTCKKIHRCSICLCDPYQCGQFNCDQCNKN